LIGIDDEIFSQDGQPAGFARLDQIIPATHEELLVGQYRQAGRAVPPVGCGDRHRIKIRAQHPFARTRFLDFGDHRWQAGGNFRAQRADEIARLHRIFGVATQRGKRALLLRHGHFFALNRENLFQNV